MELVYVIGPYRARTANDVLHNILAARAVAEELWERGYAVITPHLNSAFMDGLVPDERFLEADREILRRCDAFALVKGWEWSAGSRREVELALSLGLRFVPTRRGAHALNVEVLQRDAERTSDPTR